MVQKVEGTTEKYNSLIEEIIKSLKKTYGSYWNFTIDLQPDSDIKKKFSVIISVSKK